MRTISKNIIKATAIVGLLILGFHTSYAYTNLDNVKGKIDSAKTINYVVTETELDLEIENWMINEASFVNFYNKSNDDALNVECWMLSIDWSKPETVTSESELSVENWMTQSFSK